MRDARARRRTLDGAVLALSGSGATVLALRALGLGDALTGVPALRGLRRAWPAARLVLAAPAAVGRLLVELGVVDESLDCAPPAGVPPVAVPWPAGPAPDVAVNLHGCGPQSHDVLRALQPRRLVAFANADAGFPDGPVWDAGEHEVDRWCRLARTAGGSCDRRDLLLAPPAPRGDCVVVHPGAASGSRRWPAQRWTAVTAALLARGRRVVVTGTRGEAALCGTVAAAGAENRCGALSLGELAATVATAGLVLSGDTGVAHLATAYRTPSVVLFGPTPPSQWGPAVDPELHAVLWRGRDGEQPGDPHGDRVDPRLGAITVDDVLSAVQGVGSRVVT